MLRPRSRLRSPRTRPARTPLLLLACAALALAPTGALAQDDDALDFDEEAIEEAEGGPSRTLGDAGVTITRALDLMIVRPTVGAMGAVGAVTYVLAVGPTLLFQPDQFDEVTDQLVISPWRFIFLRPLGSPVTPAP